MADVLKTSGRSLVDMVKNLDADGNTIMTAEILQKSTPMLQDAPIVFANNILSHKVSVRTALPKPEIKRLNQGVGGAFGARDTKEFGMKLYQSLPWIDKMEFKFAKDPNEVRQSNMEGVLQGWAQGIELDFLYDNVKTYGADSINGIATYANALEGNRVIDAAGGAASGSKYTSIYLVAWDKMNGAFAIAPENATAGIVFQNLGDDVIADELNPGKRIEVEQYKVESSLGFGVVDPRAVARIANIASADVADTTKDLYKKLPVMLMRALSQFPANLRDKVVIYAPKSVDLALQLAANDKSNASFVYGSGELWASRVPTFNGTPIRISEMILDNEEAVA